MWLSDILLPGDEPLTLKKVFEGLYVIQNAYTGDNGFFSRLPFHRKKPLVPEPEAENGAEGERPAKSFRG
jgi:hypothetical protein